MSFPLQNPPPNEESDSLQHATLSFEGLLRRSPAQAINSPSSNAGQNMELMELSNPFQGTPPKEDRTFEDLFQHRTPLLVDLMSHRSPIQAVDNPFSNPDQNVNPGSSSAAGDDTSTEMVIDDLHSLVIQTRSSSVSQVAEKPANRQKRVIHKCHTCGEVFPTYTLLQRHDCNHELSNLDTVMVPPKRTRKWTREVRSSHNEPYPLPQAPLQYRSRNQLARTRPVTHHQRATDRRNRSRNRQSHRSLKCNICAIAFVKKSHLELHRRLTHTATVYYTCHGCPCKFVDRIDRAHHELIHLDEDALRRLGRLRREFQAAFARPE